MSTAQVILFKPSGKYYTEEHWRIPEGALGPFDMAKSIDFRRIDGGAVLVDTQEPWGYPHLIPANNEGVWHEARAERQRAVAIHGSKAMDAYDPDDYARLAILMEEVGEVACEFNEAIQGDRYIDMRALREELIQVAAMAGAWADVIPRG